MPKKAKTALSDRELKYWMTKHCPRNHCWIVVARIGEIIAHPERVVYLNNMEQEDYELNLTQDNLEYVYFAEFDEKSLLTLVQDNMYYYIIRNQNAQEEKEKEKEKTDNATEKEDDGTDDGIRAQTRALRSEICIYEDFRSALSGLRNTERKRLAIKKAKLTVTERSTLENIVNIDFINKSDREQKHLWFKYLEQQTSGTLDLSGFFMLKPENMSIARPNEEIHTLILYQNNKITSFDWLKHLPKLNNISIWFSNMLLDEHIENLVQYGLNIQKIQLHYCYQVTGRCLKYFSKMPMLNEIILDNPSMSCQPNTFKTVLSEEEWSEMSNDSVEVILINSNNMTVDFAYYLTQSFHSLGRLVITQYLIEKMHKSTTSGYDDDELIFQAFQNVNNGFKRRKTVKFFNLLRDKINKNLYSDSMLKIMKSKNQNKKMIAQ